MKFTIGIWIAIYIHWRCKYQMEVIYHRDPGFELDSPNGFSWFPHCPVLHPPYNAIYIHIYIFFKWACVFVASACAHPSVLYTVSFIQRCGVTCQWLHSQVPYHKLILFNIQNCKWNTIMDKIYFNGTNCLTIIYNRILYNYYCVQVYGA